MISRLTGVLLEKQPPDLVVEIGGIAYELQAPMSSFYNLPDLGQKVMLHTHFVVREDAQQLYGFISKNERSLFRALIKVNGVGPKLALTILSSITPDNFVSCVENNDTASLVRLPGVGKKTADRLIIEMRDRLQGFESSALNLNNNLPNNASKDAISALIALGYRAHDANKAITKHKDKELTSEELIRIALQEIAG